MKTANLVIAIIYTVILASILAGSTDTETTVGVLLLSLPVIMNWISYSKWPKV